MPIFAPAYRPTKAQETYLARQHKVQSGKRKRGQDSDEDEGSTNEDEAVPRPSTTTYHPVNKTDPYHVAGHPREQSLPPLPFPHAAIPEPSQQKLPIDEELAKLNPPLYVSAAQPGDKSASLKRRHLDNLTTILHKCMLKGDWQRASRAWALLIRTDINGRGVDVRRNGRWGIGAEVLLRRGSHKEQEERPRSSDSGDQTHSSINARDAEQSKFSDEGFKLAKEYYERLILQYPHTPSTQHYVNALAFYPALFNVWIYEMQDRSQRARRKVSLEDSNVSRSFDRSSSEVSLDEDQNAVIRQARNSELEEALPIALRMDDLLLSPPYDTSSSLLQLRGMVALWIADLHNELAEPIRRSSDDREDEDIRLNKGFRRRLSANPDHEQRARSARERAKELFTRLKATGIALPREASDFLSQHTD